jgi:hypothetical protein
MREKGTASELVPKFATSNDCRYFVVTIQMSQDDNNSEIDERTCSAMAITARIDSDPFFFFCRFTLH